MERGVGDIRRAETNFKALSSRLSPKEMNASDLAASHLPVKFLCWEQSVSGEEG